MGRAEEAEGRHPPLFRGAEERWGLVTQRSADDAALVRPTVENPGRRNEGAAHSTEENGR